MELLDIAKRVKRGVRLLDRRIPNWRAIMRKHRADFNIGDPECCILGTLEHHVGRLKVLRARRKVIPADFTAYHSAARSLRIEAVTREHGFERTAGAENIEEYRTLQALWLAEFER